MSDVAVFCQYCDDIRLEVGNKVSLMGLYAGEALLPQIPAVLPKLCALVACKAPIDKPFRSLAVAASSRARGIIGTTEIPAGQLESIHEAISARNVLGESWRFYVVNVQLVMSPFPVDEEDILSITVTADGETIDGGRLALRRAAHPVREDGGVENAQP